MEQFLAHYGALGVFLGAALEGQTAVVIGGLLARQAMIPVWLVFVCAAAGSALLDQLLFVGGRRFRSHRLVARMMRSAAFARSMRFIERFPFSFTLAFRFLYGLRAAGPVAIGISRMPTLVFTLLNTLAAAIWAAIFTGLGYLFGHAFENLLGRSASVLQRTAFGVGALVVAVAAFAIIRRIVSRRRARSEPGAAD